MAVERTLVNIYPGALERSITGDIISMIRVMPELSSELKIVAANIYALTPELSRDFVLSLLPRETEEENKIREAFKRSLLDEESFDQSRYNLRRIFHLVIEGESAVARIAKLMGETRRRNGVTIRGRYGFLKRDEANNILASEFPASAPLNRQEAELQLEIFWKKHRSCAGPLKDAIKYSDEEKELVERSVVIVKPNTFNNPHDPRLGNVIDAVSRAGAYIVAAKVQLPTKEQMRKFYAAHQGKHFFDGLVDFMTSDKSLALLYEGVKARQKIREAALSVIRGAYSDSKLENTVHTSETEEDFLRECEAIRFEKNNPQIF